MLSIFCSFLSQSHWKTLYLLGMLDVLFNCAGLLCIGRFAELPLDKQMNQIHVNVTGVAQLTYEALPLLKATKDSRVITMARWV